jgi:CheY-like chemotaxis protein
MSRKTDLPRVLVVDDESTIADTLVLILNKSGYEATAAYSGEQALELAPTIEPGLLISDVAMKGIDGIETAICLRNLFPACKVVLFSGQAHAIDLLAGARKRGYSFEVLRKPMDPAVLLSHIRSLLDASDGEPSPSPNPDLIAGGGDNPPAPLRHSIRRV